MAKNMYVNEYRTGVLLWLHTNELLFSWSDGQACLNCVHLFQGASSSFGVRAQSTLDDGQEARIEEMARAVEKLQTEVFA